MIINTQEINVEKSSNFESTDFRIDAKYKNKVLWMLINQYRFKIRTPIQEIVSNARDAQRENGNPDKPIKIQLPTKIEPTFIVRDYGVGMDENRIKTIFTSFGASTKNSDNTQTGGFGIGAKSPLAYTDSFNIKTYVDGKYWFYVVAKTSDDGLGINLLSHGDTNEENGTEVQIPVASQDVRSFIEGACRTTMFWDVQPDFNLSEEDLYRVNNGTEIAEGFSVYKKSNLGNLFNADIMFVIDGIPYEVDGYLTRKVQKLYDITEKIGYHSIAVIELNTGDIDLLQTREAIEETDKTIEKLQKIGFKSFSDLGLYLESCFTEKTLEGRIKQFNDLSAKFKGINYHKFETFKISPSYVNISPELWTLTYNLKDRYGRSTLIRPKRYTGVGYSKKHEDTTEFFWDDLKESESDNKKATRLRTFLADTRTIPVLIEQHNATKFVYIRTLRMLGAKKLSSLALPEKTVRVKGAKKVVAKKPSTITVHTLSSYSRGNNSTRTPRTVNLKGLETNYVYTGYNDNSIMDSEQTNATLKDRFNLIPCKLSKGDIKAIQGNENFIHIDTFLESFKPTDSMINTLALVLATSGEYYAKRRQEIELKEKSKLVCENITRIQDKVLTRMAQSVTLLKEGVELDRNFKNLIREKYQVKIESKAKIMQMFLARLERKYPLARLISKRSEFVTYINGGK